MSGKQVWLNSRIATANLAPRTSSIRSRSDTSTVRQYLQLTERNFFHTAVKYHRDDRFLRDYLLPNETADELEAAWSDLLTSFDYHDVNVRFVCKKFGIQLPPAAALVANAPWLQAIDDLPRQHIAGPFQRGRCKRLGTSSTKSINKTCLTSLLATWHRPLTTYETNQLKDFYTTQRNQYGLGHASAIRASLVRVLVSPDFLFRVERTVEPNQPSQHARDLTPHELANRLSFSLWSSIPDDELRELADRNALNNASTLEQQVQRMLQSPKSNRLSTEFFGQWLGFYQFDRFRGVDARRFPSSTEHFSKRCMKKRSISARISFMPTCPIASY